MKEDRACRASSASGMGATFAVSGAPAISESAATSDIAIIIRNLHLR